MLGSKQKRPYPVWTMSDLKQGVSLINSSLNLLFCQGADMCFPVGQVQAINDSNRFEAEIRQEQEVKKKQAEEQKQRRAAFKELQSAFK